MIKSFKDVIQKNNCAAIYVTHDLALVAQIADEVIVLLNGEVQEQAPIAQIVDNPQNAYTRILMEAGDPDRALEKKEATVAISAPQEKSPLVR